MDVSLYINGCDGWFDSLGPWNWRHCCDAHDIAYSTGGEAILRLAADANLVSCVNQVLTPMGFVMGAGVFAFGWLFYRYKKLGNRNIWDIITGRKV